MITVIIKNYSDQNASQKSTIVESELMLFWLINVDLSQNFFQGTFTFKFYWNDWRLQSNKTDTQVRKFHIIFNYYKFV